MKKLLLIFLFLPNILFAQKIEFSEMGGYSSGSSVFHKANGFSNQVSANYYFTKYLSLGAIYEYNGWNPTNNSFGIISDIHVKKFYGGIGVSEFMENKYVIDEAFTTFYNNSLSAFIHIGANQKLSKHIFIKEQIEYYFINISYYTADIIPYKSNSYYPPSPTSSGILNYFSALVGIAYKL